MKMNKNGNMKQCIIHSILIFFCLRAGCHDKIETICVYANDMFAIHCTWPINLSHYKFL